MPYEVEQKCPLAEADALRSQLARLVDKASESVEQVDTYYAHPGRDFAVTDEALRIRRSAQSAVMTYKGPKLDQTTKTRQEIEVPIEDGAEGAKRCDALLQALGFRQVAEVHKHREQFRFLWRDRAVEVAIDQVEGLGSFVELETLAGDQAEIEPARQAILKLAAELNLSDFERRSYLELLLAAEQ